MLCLLSLVGCGASFQEFSSADGKFKASFPGKPKELTQNAAGTTMKIYQVEERNGAYQVGYADMPFPENEPAAQLKGRLDGAVAGMAASTGGTVQSQSDITVNGNTPVETSRSRSRSRRRG
jgi:hypothetical protein